MLERAQAGLYSPFEVQRGLSARRLVEHFENRDDGFGVQARLRRRVRWRRVNLAEDALAFGGWDLILCRYVLCALTPQARGACADKLARALKPGGRIVLGVGEAAPEGLQSVRGLACVYEPVSCVRRAA
jgi:chemotaxis protein methyltransferase CheR